MKNKLLLSITITVTGLSSLLVGLYLQQSVNQNKSVELVKNLPEVQSWLNRLENESKSSNYSSQPVIKFDHKDGNQYVVHVYELVSDGAKSAHTASFNWYSVDTRLNKIQPNF